MSTEPTAEEIVGEENVVDVGSADEPEVHCDPPADPGYNCSNCTFHTYLFAELEGHVAETGHGRPPVTDPVQPQLFSEKGIVTRQIQVPMDDEFLNFKRIELADIYQDVLDAEEQKTAAVAEFNARIKALDQQMQAIARILKTPFTYDDVQCEWRLIPEENARGLYRLDTGEMIDKQPLSQEDRQAEMEAAQEANAAAEPTEVSTEQAEVPQEGTGEGQDGSQENINDRVLMGRRKKK